LELLTLDDVARLLVAPCRSAGLKYGLIRLGSRASTKTPPVTVRPGHGRGGTLVNAGQHCWKACWGQPLASSNLASSAISDQAIHKPRSCVRPGPARLHSLIHSTYIGIKRPKVQVHASGCYRGCGAHGGPHDRCRDGSLTGGKPVARCLAACQPGSPHPCRRRPRLADAH